jgi:hypothetical protein
MIASVKPLALAQKFPEGFHHPSSFAFHVASKIDFGNTFQGSILAKTVANVDLGAGTNANRCSNTSSRNAPEIDKIQIVSPIAIT